MTIKYCKRAKGNAVFADVGQVAYKALYALTGSILTAIAKGESPLKEETQAKWFGDVMWRVHVGDADLFEGDLVKRFPAACQEMRAPTIPKFEAIDEVAARAGGIPIGDVTGRNALRRKIFEDIWTTLKLPDSAKSHLFTLCSEQREIYLAKWSRSPKRMDENLVHEIARGEAIEQIESRVLLRVNEVAVANTALKAEVADLKARLTVLEARLTNVVALPRAS